MSSKDEILEINQAVSAIEKKIFETKIKQGQLLKELIKAEDELEAADSKLIDCNVIYKDIKNEDIVDLNIFKQEKFILENQIEIQKETSSNIKILKKTIKDIEDLIVKLDEYKQVKKLELNNYGQIKEFKPKSSNNKQTE